MSRVGIPSEPYRSFLLATSHRSISTHKLVILFKMGNQDSFSCPQWWQGFASVIYFPFENRWGGRTPFRGQTLFGRSNSNFKLNNTIDSHPQHHRIPLAKQTATVSSIWKPSIAKGCESASRKIENRPWIMGILLSMTTKERVCEDGLKGGTNSFRSAVRMQQKERSYRLFSVTPWFVWWAVQESNLQPTD